MARIFLYIVAGLVVLAVVAITLLAAFKDELSYWAMTPGEPFTALPAPPEPNYADPASWAARTGLMPPHWLGAWTLFGVCLVVIAGAFATGVLLLGSRRFAE